MRPELQVLVGLRPSEDQLNGHLPDSRIYRGAADDAERGRAVCCVRVRELRMIQDVEELCAELEFRHFIRPVQTGRPHDRDIYVGLTRAINNPR